MVVELSVLLAQHGEHKAALHGFTGFWTKTDQPLRTLICEKAMEETVVLAQA